MDQYIFQVVENKEVADHIYLIELKLIGTENKFSKENNYSFHPLPGQFLHIRVSANYEPLLRRPISIYDYDEKQSRVKMIYRVEGEGTRILSKKAEGDIIDALGPLGQGFEYNQLKKDQHVVLIGGGIGIPPLYYLAKKLVSKGIKITNILGYQSKKDAYSIKEFLELGVTRVASDDGSIGNKGTVLDLIKADDKWDIFYTCGATGMMKALQNKWMDAQMDGYMSLEERMGCAIGACYGCVVRVEKEIDKKGFKKVCSDGPVFPFREVIL